MYLPDHLFHEETCAYIITTESWGKTAAVSERNEACPGFANRNMLRGLRQERHEWRPLRLQGESGIE
jgi:hypothetical protein